MSIAFSDKLQLPKKAIRPLYVKVADGRAVSATTSVSGAVIEIDDRSFPNECIVLPIDYFDVVLGMGWLYRNKCKINCEKKIVSIPNPDGSKTIIRGERSGFGWPMISVMKATKALSKG